VQQYSSVAESAYEFRQILDQALWRKKIMLIRLVHRLALALALGLLIPSAQIVCAGEEINDPAARMERYDAVTIAAASVSTSSEPNKTAASIGSAQAEGSPFRKIVAQVKEILNRNKIRQTPLPILLGEISYQNTDFASPLSVVIRARLRQEFQRFDEFAIVEPPRLRGIEIVEKPKTTAALAEVAGVDTWLTGEYWKTTDGIDLRISIRRRPGNQILGVAKAILPTGLIPGGVNDLPANLKEAQANQKLEERIAPLASSQDEKSLKIEVWVDRGKGAVYVQGEELLVFVRVNRDAYVHLYYTDATNETYRIFPNRYHSEEKIPGTVVTRIPEPQDAFTFRVKEPFGIESITALASTEPLGDLNIATLSAGPFRRVERGLRGLAVVSSAAQERNIVRDSIVLTTIPSSGSSDGSWD
jgi:hypothetical protein